jgi:hypothetical protein
MPSRSSTDIRWRGLFNDFQRSGLSQTEFCRLREISLHTFRKRLYGQKALAPGMERKGDSAVADPPRFLPVTVDPISDLPPVSTVDPLVILLPSGWRIVVGEGFDSETLRRLIQTIEPNQ